MYASTECAEFYSRLSTGACITCTTAGCICTHLQPQVHIVRCLRGILQHLCSCSYRIKIKDSANEQDSWITAEVCILLHNQSIETPYSKSCTKSFHINNCIQYTHTYCNTRYPTKITKYIHTPMYLKTVYQYKTSQKCKELPTNYISTSKTNGSVMANWPGT